MSDIFPVSGPSGGRPSSLIGPSPQSTRIEPIPAPNTGINAVDGLLTMGERGPEDSIFQYNLIPSQYGTKVRTGYSEWAIQVGTSGVKTILPYTGSIAVNDKLWAMASGGIYDVTASVTNPAVNTAFGTINSTSGYGQWTAFTTIAGHFALYCDESNGYYTYTEGGAWLKVTLGGGATQVSNVDPALFVSAVIFKGRSWFVEKNSARAWYLSSGTIYGAATSFNFGNKFKAGGYLVALYVWTVDGGEGTDDYLVAISSAGDVILYKGNDPASATDWFQHGTWYIGPPPAGRRLAGSFGGELYVTSSYGIIPLTKLISGALIQQANIYITQKISPLITNEMLVSRGSLGWEMKLISSENILLLSVPQQTGVSRTQFVQSLNTNGWAIYRDLPYFTGETWQGKFYIGTEDNRILMHTGTTDDVSIAGAAGVAINWSSLSVFQEYGTIGRYKRIHFIRPIFLGNASPSVSVEARYDYDLDQILPAVIAGVSVGALWDFAVWDTNIWGGELTTFERNFGANGIGRNLAVGLNGSSTGKVILVRYDIMFDEGGAL